MSADIEKMAVFDSRIVQSRPRYAVEKLQPASDTDLGRTYDIKRERLQHATEGVDADMLAFGTCRRQHAILHMSKVDHIGVTTAR